MRRLRHALLRGLAAVLLAAASVLDLAAQGAVPTELEVKAAYLFTFGRFVQWPSASGREARNFEICVLGADPFGPTLDTTVSGATMRGRQVDVVRLTAAAGAGGCDVLFISASEARQLTSILDTLRETDVLTVSDMSRFVDQGGMIQFVMVGNRVRFEINLSPAREAGLSMSSELLRVASAVRGEKPQGD